MSTQKLLRPNRHRRRQAVRLQRAEEQDWCCAACGQECVPATGYMNSATLDHVVPTSRGGGDDDWNLVMACHRCNQVRMHLCWMHFEHHARRFGPDTRPLNAKQPSHLKRMTATLVELVRVEQDTQQRGNIVSRLLSRMLIHRLTRDEPLLRYLFLQETLIQRHQHDTNMQRTPVT